MGDEKILEDGNAASEGRTDYACNVMETTPYRFRIALPRANAQAAFDLGFDGAVGDDERRRRHMICWLAGSMLLRSMMMWATAHGRQRRDHSRPIVSMPRATTIGRYEWEVDVDNNDARAFLDAGRGPAAGRRARVMAAIVSTSLMGRADDAAAGATVN